MTTQTVTVYSGPNCHRCEQTIRMLTQSNIAHDVVDVHEDEAAMAKIKSMGYSGLPVVITPQGEHWSGFNLMKIRSLTAQ